MISLRNDIMIHEELKDAQTFQQKNELRSNALAKTWETIEQI